MTNVSVFGPFSLKILKCRQPIENIFRKVLLFNSAPQSLHVFSCINQCRYVLLKVPKFENRLLFTSVQGFHCCPFMFRNENVIAHEWVLDSGNLVL